MKKTSVVLLTGICWIICSDWILAQTQPNFRPARTASRDPRFLGAPSEEAPTAEELAVPPAGEIQKLWLRYVNQLRTGLGSELAAVPGGPTGQQSPFFAKFQAFKGGLDQLSVSRLQTDAFVGITQMEEVFLAEGTDEFPEFGVKAAGWMKGYSFTLLHAMARHIVDQNATVSAARLTEFVKVFDTQGFETEGGEDEPPPIDGPGVMILDAASVVTQLKALPWRRAEMFLGNRTAAFAFARYESGGNGLLALKTKYAANKTTILAKWNELKAWVDEQRAAGP